MNPSHFISIPSLHFLPPLPLSIPSLLAPQSDPPSRSLECRGLRRRPQVLLMLPLLRVSSCFHEPFSLHFHSLTPLSAFHLASTQVMVTSLYGVGISQESCRFCGSVHYIDAQDCLICLSIM
eukprot:TRINITY_DN39225_c0_g1_i1.p1 TRINITY_DN39225_c0_g1~~TRINITY_DN39225_c0_g1_i1.p1  ORF type:complete len:122 (-),score=4.33 TRINITY_DN39225_c0_g1_i1:1167-1532(-)